MSQFIAFLSLQNIAGIIALTGAVVVVGVVVFLIALSSKNKNTPTENHTLRGWNFFVGVSILLVVFFFLLQLFHHPRSKGEADEIVTVVGIQWDWEMAHGISNKTPHYFFGRNEITLPVNKRIRFIVTSDDVTHNFSIYDHYGVLLSQIEAMPQYKNELEFVFPHKGKYTILCLEYCGLVHPFMTGTIYVQ